MTIALEEVCSGLGFPEGPVAMDDGAVLFVDIKEETLVRLAPDGKTTTIAKIPGGPNGVAIGPDGAAYVCNNGGVYSFVPYEHEGVQITVPAPIRPNYEGGSVHRVDLESGTVTQLFDSYEGKRLIAPDDIVFDASGGFWFTDTGIEDAESTRYGGLYYATIDGNTLVKAATIPMPNGVGLSPDGGTVYVSDTVFGRLWACEITGPGQVKPGPLSGMPGNVVQTLPGYQWLDSLKVEADGRVCVGTIFNGGITVFSLDGSTEHVAIPDLFTTNMCFGGADMQDLWITASSTGKIYKTRWPRPGLKLAFTA
ncbi:SMP-30/gluconolactonase/LRE family protein [Cognatiyoonia sp. IB215446]|uniref:SMP-30/gluconolactonase/LRE family protein n=1 Tax=Cognatiyoonia sp. IB215446 TaxID=3097355 RepID=UPI002A12B361|nr:SMP-30/gluconolactonase/LRE family protein [Cognatiyoonia sp. IB215446]MDX8350569.1 SMP-30/gluconolactonase/LRE family protein [Cognatiyoonia sp. IB215446]